MTELDEIERRGRAEGLAEGLAKGRAEGLAKGRAQMLLEVLAARFGAVPAKMKAQVLAADEKALTAWTARVFSARTPEDVIAEGGGDASAARRAPARKRARRA